MPQHILLRGAAQAIDDPPSPDVAWCLLVSRQRKDPR